MSLSLVQLRAETLDALGIDATDLDATGTANLDLLINRSFWQVCDDYKFKEKEQIKTFNTIAATRDYVILTQITPLANEAIQSLSYKSLNDSQHTVLERASIEWYEDNYNEQASLQSYPQKWFHYNGTLRIYPTPDQVYTITLVYYAILADLSNANQTVVIPQNWHEAVLYGAIKRGFLRARDFNSATFWDSEYAKKIGQTQPTDAKEDALNKTAGARVLRPIYSVKH